MTVNFATGDEQKYSSNIVSINHFTDASRNLGLPSTSAHIAIEFDFTKSFADTSIVLWGYTPVSGQNSCLLYTSPSPRDTDKSRMPSSA